jgi:uncharacterized repeat protein (TIGR01451 family)
MMKKLLLICSILLSCIAQAQIGLVQPPNIEYCHQFNNDTFNLTAQAPVVLGSLNPASYTVTYHLTLAAANAGTNAISNPSSYINASNPQVIYIRVAENANPSVFEVKSFSLILNLQPSVYEQNFTVCDLNGSPSDGLTLYDLEEIAEQVYFFSSIDPSAMEVTFYATQADAQNQANGLSSPYANTTAGQVIYARCSYYISGCTTIIPITLLTNDCTGQCLAPDDLAVTINGSTTTFGWTPVGAETQWELLVLYSGGPFPLPTMEGTVVSNNPVTFSSLECPESYDVYIRAVCGTDISDWSERVTFDLENCNTAGGDPINLTACAQSGSACFDLTINDSHVLGGLNPAENTITYHASHLDATEGINAITNTEAYCTTVAQGSTNLYVRLYNSVSEQAIVSSFTVTAQETVIENTPLQPMVQCDDDADGTVIFDLTAAAAQIGINPLAYYNTLSNALTQTNAIAGPTVFSVDVLTPLTTLYIRETVAGSCDHIYTLSLNALSNCNFANVCIGANSLCSALGVPFTNTTGIAAAEEGNAYGCLGEIPNPTWFYLPVSASGTINLKIEQSSDIAMQDPDLDVDFICYGPFTDPVTPCSGQLIADKIVDCSYSSDSVEFPVITNAVAGQFYIIMTTNYSDEPGYVRISEVGTSQGEIDCTGLRLNAFIDQNSNGIKDSGESDFALGQFHYEMNGSSVLHNITSPSGIHRIYDYNTANSYELSYSVNPDYASFYGVSASSYTNIHPVSGTGLQEYAFPVTVLQPYNDVSVTIIPDQAPRPGFTYTNTVVYTNLAGQAVTSGTINFVKDPSVSIVSNSAGAVNDASGFTYNFSNLLPFESRSITVIMQVPTIPTVTLGALLTSSVSISPLTADATPQNNTAESAQEIIGSFDPNDIMEAHGSEILAAEFTSQDYLYYTIRFENTGTASAINIRVNDMLDEQLDENTVEMVRASHGYTLDRIENRLTWNFENVQLPPTIQNPVASHGFIHFRVKPKPGYAAGDIIPNTAAIYFDFNPAVITNTFETHFVNALSVGEVASNGFLVYPNPAGSQVTVSMRDNEGVGISEIALYDMVGKIIKYVKPTASSAEALVDTSDIAPGIYLIEVTSGNAKSTKKLIIR